MNMRTSWRSHPATRRTASRFLREEQGSITIFAIVAFIMCIVVVGLAFDFGRVMGIHTEVSSFADRVALSAAAKLNGQDDALDNAVDKAYYERNSLPRGQYDGVRMSLTGGDRVEITRLTFSDQDGVELISWRPRGGFSGSASDKRFAARNARYVSVETSGAEEKFLLFPIGGADVKGVTVSPKATAGYERRVCNISPVMVCNPDETGTNKTYNANSRRNAEPFYLRGMRTAPGQTRRWRPGTYSLFETATRDPTALHNLVSSNNPGTACYGWTISGERNLNDTLERRRAIGEGFNDRPNNQKSLPVAVVNCDQYNSQLELGSRVPIQAFAMMEIDEDVEFGNPTRDDRVMLRRDGPMDPYPSTHLHEYPVLVK